jgi:alpha/beta superfamily hydrolase
VGARDARVEKLLGIGLALNMFDYSFLDACAKPKAIIQAANDEYGGRAPIEAAVARMAEPKRLWVVDDATHLFPQHLGELEAAASSAATWLRGS